jgi:hypoxanthine phosphoribosyltransferase
MRCELVSWERFLALTRDLAALVRASGFAPDMIVAIERGGYMPARLLSDRLELFNLAGFKIEHYRSTHKQAQVRVRYPLAAEVDSLKILLVDDVTDDGRTFEAALAHLHERGTPSEVRTAVLHHKAVSPFVPDYYAAEISEWRWLIYPWAMLEDVSGFIRVLGIADASIEQMQGTIERAHGVRIDRATLADARLIVAGES